MVDQPDIRDWIGRTREDEDRLDPHRAATLTALTSTERFDADIGRTAPPLAHWACFPEIALQSALGEDGHPRRGGFLPPVTLPRRMWAAGSIEWHRPPAIGAMLRRRSTVADVTVKRGRSGDLVFVRVEHEIRDEAGPLIGETQEIVYRDAPVPGAAHVPPKPAPPADWSDEVLPDPVLLFRYSALTANTHRIHYDRPFATDVEGYPGLVVHGPLIATLLLHHLLARHPGANPVRFAFRAVRPLFDGAPFRLCGSAPSPDGSIALHAADADGALCMDAVATLS